MNQISLDAKGGQFLADLANWQRESAPDNSADLERLRRNLRFARQPPSAAHFSGPENGFMRVCVIPYKDSSVNLIGGPSCGPGEKPV